MQLTGKILVILCGLSLLANVQSQEDHDHDSGNECKIENNCWAQPDGCTANCKIFRWSRSSTDGFVDFSMSCPVTSANHYFAFALGPQGRMMNSDLYFCTYDGQSVNFGTGAIRERYRTPIHQIWNENTPSGITNVQTSLQDGILKCRFSRQFSVIREISGRQIYDFDISKKSYYLLWAEGAISSAGRLLKHNSRGLTNKKYDLIPPIEEKNLPSPDFGSQLTNEFTAPSGCQQNCKQLTWKESSRAGYVEFSMSRPVTSANQYVAFAFSSDNKMKDADLYFCSYNGNVVRFGTGSIRGQYRMPIQDNSKSELKNIVTSLNNGIMTCSFSRPHFVVKTISNGRPAAFDISKNSYYLLWAEGRIGNDGKLLRHQFRTGRGHSTIKIKFASAPIDIEGRFEQFPTPSPLIASFLETFQYFDTNEDLAISLEELDAVLKERGENLTMLELRSMMSEGDSDNNGSVDTNEFLNMMQAFNKKVTEKDLGQAFMVFDKNKDGFIVLTEIKALLNGLEQNFAEAKIEQMFIDADLDRNNQVDYNEFVKSHL